MWLIRILYCVSCFILVTDIHTEATLQFNITSRIKWIKSGLWSKLTTSTVEPTPESSYNPCEPYNPTKPDFRARGRRINEAKCLEYIWERENRENRRLRDRDCYVYKTSLKGRDLGEWKDIARKYPHMGSVGWRAVVGTWVFKCGASLISSKFMLTAAHCSKDTRSDTNIVSLEPEIVRFGDRIHNVTDVDIKPIDAEILRIIVHPKYSSPHRYFDIAVIELVEERTFSSVVQPACLWNKFDTNEIYFTTVTGWGVTETASRLTSPILQAAVVDIIDSKRCDKLLQHKHNRKWGGVEDHQICAGKLTGGVDACKGDSGGPLQVEIPLPYILQGLMHYLIGVTSFGYGCALPNLPGVYTRVSSFVDWIEGIVWPEG